MSGTYSDTWFGGQGRYGRIGASALGFFPAAMGIDIAFSNEDWARYFVFGSSWLK